MRGPRRRDGQTHASGGAGVTMRNVARGLVCVVAVSLAGARRAAIDALRPAWEKRKEPLAALLLCEITELSNYPSYLDPRYIEAPERGAILRAVIRHLAGPKAGAAYLVAEKGRWISPPPAPQL